MQSFKMAIRSIISNKMRSFLTMLGIIIGVASVIMLVSIVSGYMGSMTESFASMGVDRVNVNVTNTPSRVLDPSEMYEFTDSHPDVFKYVSPSVTPQGRLKYKNETLSQTSVGGYSEDYLSVMGYEIEAGRNLAYSDMEGERHSCVLGYYTAWYMFGSAEAALGQNIKIGNTRRQYVKELIAQISRDNPGADKRLFRAVIDGKIEGWPPANPNPRYNKLP